MILAWTLLVGLGAYRLYRIPAEDSISEPFREWLSGTVDTATGWRSTAWTYFEDLLLCPWCIGYWWSGVGAWLVADMADYSPAEFALVWLGGSTVCGVVRAIVERLTR